MTTTIAIALAVLAWVICGFESLVVIHVLRSNRTLRTEINYRLVKIEHDVESTIGDRRVSTLHRQGAR